MCIVNQLKERLELCDNKHIVSWSMVIGVLYATAKHRLDKILFLRYDL